jgi:hypothetical protein
VILKNGNKVDGSLANREIVRSKVHLLTRISILTADGTVESYDLDAVMFVIVVDGDTKTVIDPWTHREGGLSVDTSGVQTGRMEGNAGIASLTCEQSLDIGRKSAAEDYSSANWLAYGVLSGLLLGLVGTGLITIFGAVSNPAPGELPANVDKACYMNGYTGKAKSKNTLSALGGGLIGTVIFVVIYVSATE